jgi:hypothetical protein
MSNRNPSPSLRDNFGGYCKQAYSMQVCAFKMSVLRKAITRMRKQMRITGPKGIVQLKELLLQHGGVQETEGSATALRKRWTAVSRREHPPVSKMSAQAVIKYLYKTAAAPLDWDWTTVITDGEKVRISKRCKKAPGTGQVADAPAGALPRPKKVKDDLDLPRELTTYQKHMSDTIRELKSSNPGMSAKDRFKEAVRLWNRGKNVSKTRAEIRRGQQARKRRAANPLPESEPIEFQTAPRKKQAAAPTRSAAAPVTGKLTKLTDAQKRQIDQYNPRRNPDRLKKAVRMHMMRGLSFEQARKRAENPMGVRTAVGARFADDIAQG